MLAQTGHHYLDYVPFASRRWRRVRVRLRLAGVLPRAAVGGRGAGRSRCSRSSSRRRWPSRFRSASSGCSSVRGRLLRRSTRPSCRASRSSCRSRWSLPACPLALAGGRQTASARSRRWSEALCCLWRRPRGRRPRSSILWRLGALAAGFGERGPPPVLMPALAVRFLALFRAAEARWRRLHVGLGDRRDHRPPCDWRPGTADAARSGLRQRSRGGNSRCQSTPVTHAEGSHSKPSRTASAVGANRRRDRHPDRRCRPACACAQGQREPVEVRRRRNDDDDDDHHESMAGMGSTARPDYGEEHGRGRLGCEADGAAGDADLRCDAGAMSMVPLGARPGGNEHRGADVGARDVRAVQRHDAAARQARRRRTAST